MLNLGSQRIQQLFQPLQSDFDRFNGFGHPAADLFSFFFADRPEHAAGSAPCRMNSLSPDQFNDALAELTKPNAPGASLQWFCPFEARLDPRSFPVFLIFSSWERPA